ncbi:LCP family protein [Cryobacterium fucosi]|uniref:LytR family transcriptional regulator n=1 Tax=Cryobacterium fucosi TaxID=1259157 RepID=A0A4R9AZM1_9MICO|nr:LCP family protein [Cryobacterium fucosi]TFD73279.1 LytR family transcriptional regulator [Cryobacterium fucosi]
MVARKRHPWRIVWGVFGAVVLLLLSIGGVYAFTLVRTFDAQTEKIANAFPADADRPPPAPDPGAVQPSAEPGVPAPAPTVEAPATQAQNILFLGSDTRGATDRDLAGIRGERSDTIMVVHVPADRKNLYVMSILRDSWLEIPGHGTAKINAALSWGGVPLAVQTVETLLGVRIDHVAVVDFAGFKEVTDLLGGVDISNPIGFESYHLKGRYFDEGRLHLNGTEAMAFARERYAFADGDFQRVRNQQLIIQAVLVAMMHKSVLADVGKTTSLVNSVTPYLAVDEGFTAAYLTGLAWELRGVREPEVEFFTMPTNGTGTSRDGQSIVNIDWSALVAVQNGFKTDTLGSYQPEVQTIG